MTILNDHERPTHSFGKSVFELNSLPQAKILSWTNFKVFADNRPTVAYMVISVSDGIENIVGKGENITYLFPHNRFHNLIDRKYCIGCSFRK